LLVTKTPFFNCVQTSVRLCGPFFCDPETHNTEVWIQIKKHKINKLSKIETFENIEFHQSILQKKDDFWEFRIFSCLRINFEDLRFLVKKIRKYV